jgi:hypothetical protein
MYGAIVVDPANPNLLPHVHHAYVLVSGEWYLNGPGDTRPTSLDMVKAHQMTPDWVTWNGYAAQYVKHPLTAHPGHTVRFYVVDAARASTQTSTSSARCSSAPGWTPPSPTRCTTSRRRRCRPAAAESST